MYLILVGGFLGAGKTTLLYHAAQRLAAAGHTVGLITNDQAPDLVDTALLSHTGAQVREVPGSCFCCNFNGLMAAVDSLRAAGATHIVAEPVGSCTDLASTIVRPMQQLHPEIAVAPLTVLVDPQRVRDVFLREDPLLHPDAAYILDLQLREADRILLSKADTLPEGETAAFLGYLREHYPHAPVEAMSLSGESTSLAAWIESVLAPAASPAGAQRIPVDYDRYAHGEAVLGWLNATYRLRWIQGLQADWRLFVTHLLTRLQDNLRETGSEVGHIKLHLETAADPRGHRQILGANLTGLHHPYVVHEWASAPEATPRLNATLTVNGRAQMSPELLDSALASALDAATFGRVAASPLAHHALVPGRPLPTHRL